MTIYDQIASNRRKTFVVMTLFVFVISLLCYVFGEIYGGSGAGVYVMIMGVGFSSLSAVSSYYFSGKIVLSIAGAKKVERAELPVVYGDLENLCIGSGIKKNPDLYLIDDTAINAFATGRDPDHAVVCVTKGLLERLNKREVEAVLAHELSHVKNYDIRLMTIVVILVGSITMIANILLRSNFRRSSDSKSGGGILLLVGIVLAILSPLIAELIKFAVSRNREYLADSSAALLTRDPEGLASALEKISTDTEVLEVANEATAHMYISNPLVKNLNASRVANLFNTHPPIAERISRLRSM
ncbi:zinc metalloprotease HtpX [candidate division WWE3 bacterium CG_4_9_14_3_um_filter_34_6]|uniref:Protease HtpX homolog n=1 Tax=candidate division WWE3 bacterium CG_4_9_14_3_um_filter_34_6 TaxID=1975079 RepID=A0A2M7X4H7_UNCKA|nr:MAG: zinc metalloprotease HtpX [candidate division WWE3 bacterium CG_4_9_14_3_um_filter_34_6]